MLDYIFVAILEQKPLLLDLIESWMQETHVIKDVINKCENKMKIGFIEIYDMRCTLWFVV